MYRTAGGIYVPYRYAPAQPSASTGLRFAPSEAQPISCSEFGTTPTGEVGGGLAAAGEWGGAVAAGRSWCVVAWRLSAHVRVDADDGREGEATEWMPLLVDWGTKLDPCWVNLK
jgi:hypothetical protein